METLQRIAPEHTGSQVNFFNTFWERIRNDQYDGGNEQDKTFVLNCISDLMDKYSVHSMTKKCRVETTTTATNNTTSVNSDSRKRLAETMSTPDGSKKLLRLIECETIELTRQEPPMNEKSPRGIGGNIDTQLSNLHHSGLASIPLLESSFWSPASDSSLSILPPPDIDPLEILDELKDTKRLPLDHSLLHDKIVWRNPPTAIVEEPEWNSQCLLELQRLVDSDPDMTECMDIILEL